MRLPDMRLALRAAILTALFGAWAGVGVLVAQDATAPVAGSALVRGRIMDSQDGSGVAEAVVLLEELGREVVTDPSGRFVFSGLVPGPYTLTVAHLGYGRHTQPLIVEDAPMIALRVLVSQRAIELEPIVVEARTRSEQLERASGTRTNVITREEMQETSRTSRHLGDVLRQRVPGIRTRENGPVAGARVCVEFRTHGSPRFANTCKFPTVFLDGVRVYDPQSILSNIDLQSIRRVEVVPPAEAGMRFGSESAFGVLLIETVMFADFEEADALLENTLQRSLTYDWAESPDSHSTWKVLAVTAVANAAAVAGGVAIADNCLDFDELVNDVFASNCQGGATLAAHAALFGIPLMTTALTTRLMGGTDHSHGRILPTALLAAAALLPGYAMSTSSVVAEDHSPTQWGGRLFVLVGVPFAATMADKLFRRLHERPGG